MLYTGDGRSAKSGLHIKTYTDDGEVRSTRKYMLYIGDRRSAKTGPHIKTYYKMVLGICEVRFPHKYSRKQGSIKTYFTLISFKLT